MTQTLASAAAAAFTCPIFVPGDAGYPAEVTGLNLIAHRTPQLAIGATNDADIVAAIEFARTYDLPVTSIGGGHGATDIPDGLLVSTRRMQAVSIDPAAQTATFQAGVLWSAVVAAGMPHGLVPIAGSCSQVGAIGYLLGGGTSPLGRSHGYSADYLDSITLVTGTGELITASATHHPELFWALRGGKAGFGIVTEVTLRLVSLPQLYAGALAYAEDQLEPVLRGWIDWARTADQQVTTSLATVAFPDLDDMPPPFRGKRIVFLRFAYPGDPERGAELAAPLRALAPALSDTIDPMPADQTDHIHNDPTNAMAAWEAGAQLGPLDQRFADAWLAQLGAGSASPLGIVELRHNGGQQRIAPPGGDAVADRAADFTLHTICIDPTQFATAAPSAAHALLTELLPWSLPVANVNFIGNNPFATPWSPDVTARLTAIRQQLDPEGRFPLVW